MTERQRDYGKVISIAVMAAIILMGVLSSCTVYKQPQMKITSVLAVTAEGDTLKLPIDVIRPIYNYNTYRDACELFLFVDLFICSPFKVYL